MSEQVRERPLTVFNSSTSDALTPQYSNAAPMDPLSDVLRAVRLNGAHFYHVEAGGTWSVLTVPAKELVPRILPNAEHLISYHIVLNGSCWGGPLGEQIMLNAGDVIVFPHGDAHLMSSAKDYVDRSGKSGSEASRFLSNVYLGPNDIARNTELVCGFLGCDSRPFNPLIAALPRVIVIPGAAGGFLSQFPQQVVAESRTERVGSETMLTRMAELGAQVGYESEAAFSRAFKRETGLSPAAWRRRARQTELAVAN